MTIPERPRIRPLELVPLSSDRQTYALRDPHGFSGTVALPQCAAKLVTLMDGERTLGDLRRDFEAHVGKSLTLDYVRQVVEQLDEQYFLSNDRFAEFEAAQIAEYRALDVRPAAHAGGAYQGEEEALRHQLSELFTCDQGPGLLPWEGNVNGDFSSQTTNGRLCGVMSPHIDFHRGGPTFAWAYDRVVTESDAELFVILGTAHTALSGMFSVSQKHFDTPLGQVETDRSFVEGLFRTFRDHADEDSALEVFRDELPHRQEHSIEFQALMLQFALGGRRNFQIVPILVGSFHPFIAQGRQPSESSAITSFIDALQDTVYDSRKQVCFVAGVDMAHIGSRFGDEGLVDEERLRAQWTDDQQLLAQACAGNSEGWFAHVAASNDSSRICGLAPMYTMLQAMQPERGDLLRYDQAVAEDGSSCVSFASVAFYE